MVNAPPERLLVAVPVERQHGVDPAGVHDEIQEARVRIVDAAQRPHCSRKSRRKRVPGPNGIVRIHSGPVAVVYVEERVGRVVRERAVVDDRKTARLGDPRRVIDGDARREAPRIVRELVEAQATRDLRRRDPESRRDGPCARGRIRRCGALQNDGRIRRVRGR